MAMLTTRQPLTPTWHACPQDDSQTRLITRVRMRYHWRSPLILPDLVLDVGDIVMMRKCMLGIKQRAEHASRQTPEAIGVTGQRQPRPDEPGIQGTRVEIKATQ